MAKDKFKSPLAKPAFTSKVRKRRNTLFGICVHTTGRGVLNKAKEKGKEPADIAIGIYRRSAGPHYCIEHDGTIHQIQPDNWFGAHVGISAGERSAYLSGEWEKRFRNNIGFKLWKERWPNHKSPQHLYPSNSPNADYIGVELIPLEDATFTDKQYQALAQLCNDRAKAHAWPENWASSPRLVGHEDLDAFERWNSKGGWDPGALKSNPTFDWIKFKNELSPSPVSLEIVPLNVARHPKDEEKFSQWMSKLLNFLDELRTFKNDEK